MTTFHVWNSHLVNECLITAESTVYTTENKIRSRGWVCYVRFNLTIIVYLYILNLDLSASAIKILPITCLPKSTLKSWPPARAMQAFLHLIFVDMFSFLCSTANSARTTLTTLVKQTSSHFYYEVFYFSKWVLNKYFISWNDLILI